MQLKIFKLLGDELRITPNSPNSAMFNECNQNQFWFLIYSNNPANAYTVVILLII